MLSHLPRNFITKEDAQKMIEERGMVITVHLDGLEDFYFASSHSGPEGSVPVTCCLPMHVVPREGLESGLITNVDEYLHVFHQNDRLLISAEDFE